MFVTDYTMHLLDNVKKIHFIGCGGSGMYPLIQILTAKGYDISGSDVLDGSIIRSEREMGVKVSLGHAADNVIGSDLVVYSAAIAKDNVELNAAASYGIPTVERSVLLGYVSRLYKDSICVSGTHGKTTTTSMITTALELAGRDPSAVIGGKLPLINGYGKAGKGDDIVIEACEFAETFLKLTPYLSVVLNIDNDHLDYYKNIDNIVASFRKFISLLPENGVFIGCTDDSRVKRLFDDFRGNKISYGMKDADYTPANLVYDGNGCPSFDLMFRGENLGRITLHIPGSHTVIDSMAAAAVSLYLGAEMHTVCSGLAAFRNTQRRFEFYGERDGIKIYHDYAHHPAEAAAALDAASRIPHRNIYCVFQCNSYTRAKTLFTDHVTCFNNATAVLVPDIYPGREKDDGTVHARDMVAGINAGGGNAIYLGTFEEIRKWLDAHAAPGDVVITLGSGDVYKQTKKLL